jgi:hypothetical protein
MTQAAGLNNYAKGAIDALGMSAMLGRPRPRATGPAQSPGWRRTMDLRGYRYAENKIVISVAAMAAHWPEPTGTVAS